MPRTAMQHKASAPAGRTKAASRGPVRTSAARQEPRARRRAPDQEKKLAVRGRAAPVRPAPRSSSLVHEAISRAFHVTDSGSGTRRSVQGEHASECERLQSELERVMADHQRQADEIVALRALAKSLKEEVEVMQESARPIGDASLRNKGRRCGTHEFFQLDTHLEALREENTQLREHIQVLDKEKTDLQEVLETEIPRFEVLAIQSRAELASVKSQLSDEQSENDRLRKELAYYKARSHAPVRVERRTSPGQRGCVSSTRRDDKENTRANSNGVGMEADDEVQQHSSLMSSVASLSMSAASVFSAQLEDDLKTLKDELRRLHRSIDASVEKARAQPARKDRSCLPHQA